MSKEAMKLALEALEMYLFETNSQFQRSAVTALREALNAPLAEQKSGIKQVIELYDSPEQPAQQEEPVVRCMEHGECFGGECIYTSPPAQRTWVGLTDEERQSCTQSPFTADNYRAIEAKLKEKNNG